MPLVAFVLAATEGGPMIVNRMDVCAGPSGGHFGVGATLLHSGRFEPQDVDGLADILTLRRQYYGDGVVALDVGANIGTHTVAWAKRMHGWGSVIAVEAQERVFYALAGNIVLNNLFNARALHRVVGEEVGWFEVPQLDHQRPASFGSLELRPRTPEAIGQTPSGTQNVRMTTIDAIANGARVDLLKLDVEGMELEVLQGAAETIGRCHPVVFAEWMKCGRGPLQEALEQHGYTTHVVGMNLLALHEDDPVAAHMTQENSPPRAAC